MEQISTRKRLTMQSLKERALIRAITQVIKRWTVRTTSEPTPPQITLQKNGKTITIVNDTGAAITPQEQERMVRVMQEAETAFIRSGRKTTPAKDFFKQLETLGTV